MRATLLLPVLLIAGCTTVPYADESGGTINHNARIDEWRLQEIADKECARHDKEAVLTDERDLSWARPGGTNFKCVDP